MKTLIQSFFHLFGYQVKKWGEKATREAIRISNEQETSKYINENLWLKQAGIKSILDIGANTGQFAKKIRLIFPDADIFSFEPIPTIYNKLVANFEGDNKFKAFNYGLGDEEGNTDFHLNDFSDSSSFLEMNRIHKENFPFTENENIIKVQVKRLDNILNVNSIEKPYLLKLDVQGFEEKVIAGGSSIVENAEYIITEVSFVELYQNQPLFDKIYTILKNKGFVYMGNFEQLRGKDGKILQADAIFKKE
ncbi:FkbM family methyltransferase [Dysgonomonas sp. 521]|uniref:FkbM family methyltransferase n=1 Tax=Dysgonomonas sp. 521 TaxID=2302932 RepID=UPI0013D8C5FB|nr:FkbM family methyltransferase [Dysgonomonas sp. 521]NDV95253.1 FkbM family methyltransferase [Dysgonomonas sp. 521]